VKLDRRRVFTRSALAFGAVAAGELAVAKVAHTPAAEAATPSLDEFVPFDGPHQAGVLIEPRDAAVLAALDVTAVDRAGLRLGLQALSNRARELTQGSKLALRDADEPPLDSGALGTDIAPDALTVTIGFGRSVFDRYGLQAPERLERMTPFDGDRLDPALTHGDLILAISANHMDTASHALRELLRPTRDALALRWWIDGFQGAHRGPEQRSARRNLFGFRDGTGNPDTGDAGLMRQLVWTPEGGTYMAVRLIRMHIEFWDRVGLRHQEGMIGRRRDTGAPLGGTREFQDPKLEADPKGERIAMDAHIRLAHDAGDGRILRRGFNYHRGFDAAGQLDQGLIFVAFNQHIVRQFATLQKKLAGEPMTDYITPVGGGYFYAPRGASRPGDWVGSQLFAT
jgi:deferrochelatase/peroxidase EfeB